MFIADLHLHSPYSRATSKDMDLEGMAHWSRKKGIHLLGSADFTHPDWLSCLEKRLRPVGSGVYEFGGIKFLLQCEVSNIFSRNSRTYRVHTLIFAPDFDSVHRINEYLSRFGSLTSDGRPMLGLDIVKMSEDLTRICPDAFLIFAHIWTPWYSLFGSRSGFDGLREAFPDGVPENIFGFETGLSSDPPMNWMVSELDNFPLLSNSDAHSPMNIGREANVFSEEVDFFRLREILKRRDRSRFRFTVEFFPEEGKYHYDGHRVCGVVLHPKESRRLNGICPVCSRPLTLGVLHRVLDLADRETDQIREQDRIGYLHLVPLLDIIAYLRGKGKGSKTVLNEYTKLLDMGQEMDIVLNWEEERLKDVLPMDIAQAVIRMRKGQIKVRPGYDGVYGKIEVDVSPAQGELFDLFD